MHFLKDTEGVHPPDAASLIALRRVVFHRGNKVWEVGNGILKDVAVLE